MSWKYYAVTGLTRTLTDPHFVFRHDGGTGAIERYWPEPMGWVDAPSLLRFLVGDDDGADPITLAQANRLTSNHAEAA